MQDVIVGASYSPTPLREMSMEEMNEHLHIGFMPHFSMPSLPFTPHHLSLSN
jgi:hypothetical protein